MKGNACTICLGLFEDNLIERICETIENHPELPNYKSKKVNCAVSVPIILQVRQLLVWLDLLKTFPEAFRTDTAPDNSIKDAFRMIVNQKVCAKINKYADPNGILLSINLAFPNEETELQKLAKIKPELFRERSMYKKYRDFITRHAFEKNFTPTTVDRQKFNEIYSLEAPIEGIQLSDITIKGPMIFIAGRYQKLSRRLSQTPWILDGKRVIENSVQEFITAELSKFFQTDESSMIFMASGREDVDVRCLGKGRPFIVEISDAHQVEMTSEQAGEIEKVINSSGQIAIQDLQIVSRESTAYLKTGDEDKKKVYDALCVLNRPVTDEDLEKLNKPEGFQISQTTPLRVLHRRPLHDRPRMIYSMKAEKCPDHERALVLRLETQAGTYVKELVHGELGRTTPSVQSILGDYIDIVALDVVAVELAWPKEVQR